MTLEFIKRAPRRVTATIPHCLFEQLNELALHQGRSLSNLIAYLLECSLSSQP
jgi:hypothetical protein